MKLRLTDLGVKKLTPPSQGQITYWDEATPGFGIRCSTRSKSYVVMYGGKRQLKTLGRYPDIPLQEARRQARLFLTTQTVSVSPTKEYDYQAVVDKYLRDCQKRLRISTVQGYKLYLDQIRFRGSISNISQGQVLRAIEEQTTSPSSQNYAFTTFKVFFNWAVRRQYLTTNPLQVLKRPHRSTPRERVLSDNELKILLQYTQEKRGRFNDIVSLLIMTGQRRGEIAGLQWSEIDGETLTLPATRTKNKREHIVPLGTQTLMLLEEIEGGNLYVFGTKNEDKPFNGWSKSQRRLLQKTGLDPFTLHDLRRTFSTIHARINTPIHVTEKLLNHVSGTISGVAAVYNRHSYMEEMKEAVKKYEKHLEELLR